MKKRLNWRNIVGIIVFATLAFSTVYSVIRVIATPSGTDVINPDTHIRSDYTLMLVQCCLGLAVIALPAIIEKRWTLTIPNYMYILYFLFLYCAIYLGEVRNFYYVIPHWDSILHAFSGAMLGALGFTLVSILNDTEHISVILSPFFVALFAFCFALAAGTLWEIYEFSGDALFGLNMQKYRLADGTLLIGKAALNDTMKDIILDAASALIVTVIGYLTLIGKINRKPHTSKNGEETVK